MARQVALLAEPGNGGFMKMGMESALALRAQESFRPMSQESLKVLLPKEAGARRGAPRILIVDDSPTMLTALQRLLSGVEANISVAPDGRRGLEIAQSGQFDLIITDIEMPGMNGMELCKRLKSGPATRSAPIIVVSNCYDERYIEEGFRSGADAYISKTQARKELRELVEDFIFRRSVTRERVVLVVDDSATILKVIEEGLLDAAFQVRTARNGRDALNVVKEAKPDLILSDLHMPEMDGFALCRTLRNDREMAEIPFILMSADSDISNMRSMIRHGASAFLVKPFSMNQLVITAEKLLSDQYKTLLREREQLERERGLMLGGITSLILALEARDRYTRGHSDAVSALMSAMAAKMGLSPETVEQAKLVGKLHDLGKIGIRDDILLKTAPLSDQEYEIIKRHPSMGAAILAPIPSLSSIVPSIAGHHERLDGKGYPEGLKGERIPLLARIAAVADTFHALTSDRPYREGHPAEKALQILQDVKGSQLCTDCVDVFMVLMDDKEAVRILAEE